jgi:hypothetical protein
MVVIQPHMERKPRFVVMAVNFFTREGCVILTRDFVPNRDKDESHDDNDFKRFPLGKFGR